MRIHSIFSSIDGEVNREGQGNLTTFLRLQGCNMNCSWCDTKDSIPQKTGPMGSDLSVEEVFSILSTHPTGKVTITGGEPLIQKEELQSLLDLIFKKTEWNISIETNGSIDPGPKFMSDPILRRVNWIVDQKPGFEKISSFPIHLMKRDDWLKYVVTNKEEYHTATDHIEALQGHVGEFHRPRIALSPITAYLSPRRLLSWMIGDRLEKVSLNVQLHKLIDVD